jgi:hypothetical protein
MPTPQKADAKKKVHSIITNNFLSFTAFRLLKSLFLLFRIEKYLTLVIFVECANSLNHRNLEKTFRKKFLTQTTVLNEQKFGICKRSKSQQRMPEKPRKTESSGSALLP